MEDVIRVKEKQLELDPSPKNRVELSWVEVELKKTMKLKEAY